MTDPAPMGLWTTAQVRMVAGCDLAAALLLAVATLGARSADGLGHQVVWVNVGVLGLLLAVVAQGALFLVARRAVGRRRLQLLPDVPSGATAGAPTAGDDRWWWVPGTARAHRSGCQMLAGKASEGLAPAQVRSKHLIRCELCA